jgi:hypothetical protein
MKREKLLAAFATIILMFATVSLAGAQDTSPYLLGVWETGVFTVTTSITTTHQANTGWQIMNPGTKDIDLYSVFYYTDGRPFTCTATTILPNGVGRLQAWWQNAPYAEGPVKFFAFPRGRRAFDPNTVIGGFQDKRYLVQTEPQPGPTELFFSEYIEGSSYNKALEIYNGTGSAIDLLAGQYAIDMYFNGSSTATVTIVLTGTVASGDVYVVANGSAAQTILDQADQKSALTANWYNGDDAVVLRKGATIIDVIGQIGFDPGAEWGSGLTSTADNTLRRKSNITKGDTYGSDTFDPSVEWDGFAVDTFDGLGSHTVSLLNRPPYTIVSKANLKAATINSSTIGEFTAIPFNQCIWGYGWIQSSL